MHRILRVRALDRPGVRRAVRGVVGGGGVDGARGDVEVVQRAVEHLVRRLGLVRGDLVAGLVDAREGQVPVLPHLAPDVRVVDHDVRVPGRVEGVRVRIVDRQAHGLAAEPVARVVPVAVHQVHLDAVVEQVRQLADPAGPRVVADAAERVAHGPRG